MSNNAPEVHALGFVVGDVVRVFTRTGYWSYKVEKITNSGRLNLKDRNGKVIQFTPSGRQVGNRASTPWVIPLRIESKATQDQHAKDVSATVRADRAQHDFSERLNSIRSMNLRTERQAIVDALRVICEELTP